jgi:hypothetical protein
VQYLQQTRLLNNREAVFSAWSVPMDYEKDKENRLSQLSFEMPPCQDIGWEMN